MLTNINNYKEVYQIISDEDASLNKRKSRFSQIILFCLASTLIAIALTFNKRARIDFFNSTSTKPGLIRSWETINLSNETTRIYLSRLSNGYKVHIDIHRNCRSNVLPESLHLGESYLMLLKKNRIGPDEIFVQLEGASIQTILAHTEDFCGKYFAMFQVPKSGTYRIKIFRTRSKYQAVKEIAEFPRIIYDVFLDEMLPKYLSHDMPRPCEYNFTKGYWVTNSDR